MDDPPSGQPRPSVRDLDFPHGAAAAAGSCVTLLPTRTTMQAKSSIRSISPTYNWAEYLCAAGRQGVWAWPTALPPWDMGLSAIHILCDSYSLLFDTFLHQAAKQTMHRDAVDGETRGQGRNMTALEA